MAVQSAGRLSAFFPWVRSEDNPADKPSRVFGGEQVPSQPLPRNTLLFGCPSGWSVRERLFVHLCSGPRRPNDLCACIEVLSAEQGLVIKAVAIDPHVDPSMNLADTVFFEDLCAAARFVRTASWRNDRLAPPTQPRSCHDGSVTSHLLPLPSRPPRLVSICVGRHLGSQDGTPSA